MYLILTLLINASALILTAYLVPGFGVSNFATALLAAIVLGVVNTFIKPVLMILTAPLTILTLGLFSFVVNAVMLWIVALVVPGLTISGWMPAILGAIVLSVISTGLSMLFKDLGIAKKKK